MYGRPLRTKQLWKYGRQQGAKTVVEIWKAFRNQTVDEIWWPLGTNPGWKIRLNKTKLSREKMYTFRIPTNPDVSPEAMVVFRRPKWTHSKYTHFDFQRSILCIPIFQSLCLVIEMMSTGIAFKKLQSMSCPRLRSQSGRPWGSIGRLRMNYVWFTNNWGENMTAHPHIWICNLVYTWEAISMQAKPILHLPCLNEATLHWSPIYKT